MNDVDLGTIFASVELRLGGLVTGVTQSATQIKTLTGGLDALHEHTKTTASGLDALERRLRAVAQRATEAHGRLAALSALPGRQRATEHALDTVYQADHSAADAERRTARRDYGAARDAGVPDTIAREAYAAKLAAIDAREESDQARHQAAMQRLREAQRREEEAVWQAEYRGGQISNAQLADLLQKRLALYASSTARFAALTTELRRIPQAVMTIGARTDAPATPTGIVPAQTIGPSVDAELAAEDKKQKYLYQSQQESLAQYREYLNQRLALLTPYTNAWYAVAERLRTLDSASITEKAAGRNPFAALASGMETVVSAATRRWTNFRSFFQKLLAELAKLLLASLGDSIWNRAATRQQTRPRALEALLKPPAVQKSVPGTPPIAPASGGASGSAATAALGVAAEFIPGGQFAQLLGAFGGGSNVFSGLRKLFHFERGGLPPVGVPSIVGEHGPELFVPSIAGRIVPNGALQPPTIASSPMGQSRANDAAPRHYHVTVNQQIGEVHGVDDLQRAGDDLGWSLTHRLAVAK